MPGEDPIHPSQKLVAYYKDKLREWRTLYHDLQVEVQLCRELAEKSASREVDSLKVLAETAALQESLSSLRACLYRERDHVLRLTRDNDRLEMERLQDRKKIDFLLDAAGIKEQDLYLEGRAKRDLTLIAKRRVRFREVTNFNKKLQSFKDESALEKLQLKVSALEAEMQEQTSHLQDEILALTDEFELRKKEWEVERRRLTQQIESLNCRLKNAQMCKFEDMSSYLNELDKDRDRQLRLIEENDRLSRSLAICKELLGEDYPDDTRKKHENGLRVLREQIAQRDRVIEGYIEQNAILLDHVNQMKAVVMSEKDAKLKVKEKLQEREEFFRKKLDEEKKRRTMESEGFMADVKLLRSKLQSLERQIRQEQLRQRHRKDG